MQVFVLALVLTLQLPNLIIGTPSYRIITGSYLPPSNNIYYDRSNYVNPFLKYRYQNNPYDGEVYITDKYGQTSLAGSSAAYQTSSNYQNSRARALQPRCYGRICGETHLPLTRITMCDGHICGQNAHCTTISGRPVCSCLKGYIGDPLSICNRAECFDNSECRSHLSCVNERCIDPCVGVCGSNANCETRNHIPICSCPAGYTGNPFTSCRRFDPSELCHPSPCGQNTQCEVNGETPVCKCLPGYHGSPIAGCRHECDSDAECGSQYACIDFKCQNPCAQCGINAECDIVQNHIPVCKCPRNYYGNALSSCQPECVHNSDCPPGKPACFYNACKNPCEGVCGTNANCELKNGFTPVCSCPKEMTGNPFVSCRPFTKADLCEPNPCGANAQCQPGYDRTNAERPVCTCLPGYLGDPLTGCIRGECIDDAECPDHQACFEYKCQNPCRNQCGVNAMCNPRRHIAVCTCLPGYNGDSLTQCHQVEQTFVTSEALRSYY